MFSSGCIPLLLEGSNASTVLTWVRPELDKRLDQVRTQVEHIANSTHVGDGVENTTKHLTQLKFTFEALVLKGATLVIEEMIAVCLELGKQDVRDRNRAVDALMDAIVVVPSYLDRLQAGHHDLPILLLPVINELRAAYNANIVSEATLFAPSLDVPLPELEDRATEHGRIEHPPVFDESFPAFALRMRRQYENALLKWLQNQENPEILSPIHAVCAAMYRRVERMDLRRLWWIATEVLGGLLDGVTDNDVHLRRLFARLHLHLKTLANDGEDGADVLSVDAISQALLFHIAQAKTGNAGVDLLRERFQLHDLLPDRDVLIRARGAVTGRNRELYKSLGAAVRDELSLVKDALDLELRTGEVESGGRDNSHEALQRLQDTLKMMGLAASAQSIEELLPAFEASESPNKDAADETGDSDSVEGQPREILLMGLAEKLLQVESVLEEQIATLGEPLREQKDPGFIDLPLHEQRRIQSHLLDETIISLHQVQDGVRLHFDGDQKADFTSGLVHIAGALELTGEAETAVLALKLRNALGNLLHPVSSEAAIDPDQLEAVADAVAAFELYLAGCRDQQSNRGRFLEILKERLGRLPVGELKVIKTAAQPAKQAEAPAATDVKAGLSATDDSSLPPALDPELQAVFLEEYETVSAMLDEQIPLWLTHQEDSELMTEIRRGFHTLKGSGRMVGADELGDFAWHIEELLNTSLESRIDSISDVAVIVRLSRAILPALKQRVLQKPSELRPATIEAISQQAENIARRRHVDWNRFGQDLPAFLAVLLPGGEFIDQGDQQVDGLGAEPDVPTEATIKELICQDLTDNLAILNNLMVSISNDRSTTANDDQIRAIHSIAGTTALEPLARETDIARALEGLFGAQQRSGKALTDTAVWTILTGLIYLQTCLSIHQGEPDAELDDDEDFQIGQLHTLTAEFEITPEDIAAEEAQASFEPEDVPAAVQLESTEEPEALSEDGPVEAARKFEHTEDAPLDQAAPEPIDSEILSIFLEEAYDILGRCDSLLNTWRDNLPDLDIVQNLQREMHTLKGGARMSGVNAMGNLSHAMESLLERIAGQMLPPSVSAIETLEQGCDRLNTWVEQIERGTMPKAGEALMLFEHQVEALTAVPVQPVVSRADIPETDTAARELQEIPDVAVPPDEREPGKEPGGDTSGPQQIRVDADLLDSLVNSAGQISIFRSRLEQQVGHLRENLKEFDETVSRLRRQFRKLEIETETQIRSRFQQEAPDGSEEFDPLELDRFSSMQQLSRSLSESVSDLLNLQELLDESARKSDALLLQQSRVNTELQEGLMQSRMVHFGTIAPRLRRIVRTASSEIRKKARLQLRMSGGNDRLDRNVLERITAPLEHLLRNAIVHGIEPPKVRRKLKKPAEGEITITVAAEATEFVVRVEDDGAGLDLSVIHSRAIKLGLIDKNAKPQPQQLMQFILHSGFSTSKTVTGLAGRGVGMDVVNSDIKQIGGSLEIGSESGKGSHFTIRIPFTLAVMQAIGVMAGERRYLIPLASVAGVARMLPADYQKLLESDSPHYEFAGKQYAILELEPLLGEPSTPLSDDTISILMINSGDQRAALRVPELLGHREIVIKPIGPQISSVPGILGGTITGDGRVVIIIDAGPLIRHALLTDARPAPPMESIDLRPKKTLALVVDDSITMRKVTTRVLEGHDFEVITARDGIDATEQMQERIPDLLLLDIEMPRMDGYEVAEYVRADTRLRHIPIIMITSRAGEKHRERGKRAGANAYLSKPYKESDLIAEVNKLMNLDGD